MRNLLDRVPWVTGAAVVVAGVFLVVWMDGAPGDDRQGGREAAAPRPSQPRTDSTGVVQQGLPGKSSRARAPGLPGRGRVIVEVSPHRVLALVNGAPIRLEHLVPHRPGGGPVAMERRSLRMRLQRAIEAELVFQAARAAGIGLTDAQQERLDRIPSGHRADLEALAPYGLSWDSLTEEQVDLECWLTEAMLLRQNLVASGSAVAPSPDPAVQAAYEGALGTLLAALKSEADIEDLCSKVRK